MVREGLVRVAHEEAAAGARRAARKRVPLVVVPRITQRRRGVALGAARLPVAAAGPTMIMLAFILAAAFRRHPVAARVVHAAAVFVARARRQRVVQDEVRVAERRAAPVDRVLAQARILALEQALGVVADHARLGQQLQEGGRRGRGQHQRQRPHGAIARTTRCCTLHKRKRRSRSWDHAPGWGQR